MNGSQMSGEDKASIEGFASGDTSLRSEAIAAYRRNLPTMGSQGNLHQRFMAEIDTETPDLALRHHMRTALLMSIKTEHHAAPSSPAP